MESKNELPFFNQKSKSQESSEPEYYKNIKQALGSSQLEPKDNEIIFFSVGSYNRAGAREKYGYIQALPLFIENFLRANSNIKIILCDSNWTKNQFNDSDLARHLEENKLTKYRKQFYCVENWLHKNDFPDLITYFNLILQKNGAAFIAEFEGPGLINVYNALLDKKNTENYLNCLYYFKWLSIFPVKTTVEKRANTAVAVWAGEPFNRIDAALLELRVQVLSDLAGSLWGEMTKFQQAFITKFQQKNPPPMSEENHKKLEKLKIELEVTKESEERAKSIVDLDEQAYMAAVYEELAQGVGKNNINSFFLTYDGLEASDEELALILRNIKSDKKLTCQPGSLVPTTHVPLIGCKETKNSNGTLSIELRLPQCDVMDLFAQDILRDTARITGSDETPEYDRLRL